MSPEVWSQLAGGSLLLGLLKYVVDAMNARRKNRRSPVQVRQADVDANILTVAKARDELAEDNDRLRAEIRDLIERHAADRREWERREAALKAEVDRLETRLRSLLEEVLDLRTRHGI